MPGFGISNLGSWDEAPTNDFNVFAWEWHVALRPAEWRTLVVEDMWDPHGYLKRAERRSSEGLAKDALRRLYLFRKPGETAGGSDPGGGGSGGGGNGGGGNNGGPGS